ncbi:MAG: class I SAM-dependent methyltransferase [Caldilineales bacterium]|nr:class I SAM-dependent methyltransferase [Caldilineales bacterium]
MSSTGKSIQAAYNRWVDTYDSDRNLTRGLDQEVTRTMLADSSYRTILELGCGTGKNTATYAQRGERVIALDLTVGMLERARAKTASAHVVFVRADLATPWPLARRIVDLVVCNLVLEHIEDMDFVFAQAWRALTPGGRFFICELHSFRQYEGAVANFQHGEETIEIAAHVHHISDFMKAAKGVGFGLVRLDEWWHEEDAGGAPRLASFIFEKPK